MKRVDEYHLTGIVLDTFVRWEHRPPSSTDGRAENRNDVRGEGRPKPEQKKLDDTHCSEGMVSVTTAHNYTVRTNEIVFTSALTFSFYGEQCRSSCFVTLLLTICLLPSLEDTPDLRSGQRCVTGPVVVGALTFLHTGICS